MCDQEVDRIVHRLYTSHTKSSEKNLRSSREENTEQLYESRGSILPEKALEKVFRRLSLTSPSSLENSNSSFIDNPMSQSKHRRSISRGDSVTVFVPNESDSSNNNNNNNNNNNYSPHKQRVPTAVTALKAHNNLNRPTTTPRRKSGTSEVVAMTADESYSQYSSCSESKDIEPESENVYEVDELPQTVDTILPPPSPQPVVQSSGLDSNSDVVLTSSAKEQLLSEKKTSAANKPRRSSINPNPSAAEPNSKPSKDFLSKIQKFSSPAMSLGSISIEEKIMTAAAMVGMTKIPVTTPGPTLASSSASSRPKTTKSIAQTVASSHNQHQRALQLATSSQEIDDLWGSKASKVLRGQKKKTDQAPEEEAATENNYENIIMT